MTRTLVVAVVVGIVVASAANAQEPVAWDSGELEFHTFSIVAIDTRTGESGVAVTTRRPCVGNAVPWVRPGVGAVATQGGTRLEYGEELLDLLEQGVPPQEALDRLVEADEGRERRQVGVIDMQGRSAQWTGSGQYGAEAQGDWVSETSGPTFAVQGNSLVSVEVVEVVAATFAESEGMSRHLADRLVEALAAGQALGGDGRHGETQSAAVLVADPRPGMSRRPDGITVDINVCEHPDPVDEVRRVYETISETLGFRTLRQFAGRDVLQLKIMLYALGYLGPDGTVAGVDAPVTSGELPASGGDVTSGDVMGGDVYDTDAMRAVDRFRADQGWQTTVSGLVDERTIERLWTRLEEAGRAEEVRRRLLEIARVSR